MIKVLFKRILNFMPYVAAYFLALGLAAMAFAFFGENVLFKDGSFSMVKVACYLPSDNELNSAGFSFISNMNSVEDTISFIELDSPEEVRTAVDEGDVVAGLIIPEDFASGILQFLDAQAVDLCKRVGAADDDTRDAAPDDEVGTRRRLAVMGAWLQADVDGAAAKEMLVLDRGDGVHLGMRPATAAMIAFANDSSVADHHGSDHRIGRCSGLAATSQLQTSPHELYITTHIFFTFHFSLFTFIYIFAA